MDYLSSEGRLRRFLLRRRLRPLGRSKTEATARRRSRRRWRSKRESRSRRRTGGCGSPETELHATAAAETNAGCCGLGRVLQLGDLFLAARLGGLASQALDLGVVVPCETPLALPAGGLLRLGEIRQRAAAAGFRLFFLDGFCGGGVLELLYQGYTYIIIYRLYICKRIISMCQLYN